MRVPAAAVAATTVLITLAACGVGAPGGEPSPGTAGGTPTAEPSSAPTAEPSRAETDPAARFDGTYWIVDTVIAGGVASAVPAGPSGSAWLAFDGGRFIAGTGCGEVEGRFQVLDDQLRFSEVVHAIPVHCPEEFAAADQVMRELLEHEATFAVEAGQLRLERPGGTGLRLRADDPPSR